MRHLALLMLLWEPMSAFAHDSNCAFEAGKTNLSRIVAIDSTKTAGDNAVTSVKTDDAKPGRLTLNDHEVMLVFKDGPHSPFTTYILDVLDKYCVKATFFVSPKAAAANPKLVQTLERLGHTVAPDLSLPQTHFDASQLDAFKANLESSVTAVNTAMGKPAVAPFFLTTGRTLSPEITAYLGQRTISLWQADVSSGDTEAGLTASKLANQTIAKVHDRGRAVILMHDTKKVTVDALDSILLGLKAEKFKAVHVIPTTFLPTPFLAAPPATLPASSAKPAIAPSAQKPEEKRNHAQAQSQLIAAAKRQVERDTHSEP